MKRISIFRLPIFWLFLGPPAFRVFGVRSAMDSIEGGQDIWNMVRAVWWVYWGLVVVIELLKYRVELRQFLGQLGWLPVWGMLWGIAMVLSFVGAPSPTFTLANGVFMCILVLSSADFGVKLYTGALTVRDALRLLLTTSILLLVLCTVLFFTNPGMVGFQSFTGPRVRGNTVAYTPLLGIIVIFVSVYFWLTTRHRSRNGLILLIGFGLWWVYLAQTRSMYLGLVLGVFMLAWHWGNLRRHGTRLMVVGALFVVFLCMVGFMYQISHSVRWKVDSMYNRYVLRDEYAIKNRDFARENMASLNGRTDVFKVLWDLPLEKPLGSGYISGPRVYLQSSRVIERLESNAFGNAHNAFLEMWAGCGLLGLIAWIGIVYWALVRSRSFNSGMAMIIKIMLFVILIDGMFESDLVLPFKQNSVLFWILISYTAAFTTRRLHVSAAQPVPEPYPVVILQQSGVWH